MKSCLNRICEVLKFDVGGHSELRGRQINEVLDVLEEVLKADKLFVDEDNQVIRTRFLMLLEVWITY